MSETELENTKTELEELKEKLLDEHDQQLGKMAIEVDSNDVKNAQNNDRIDINDTHNPRPH